MLAVEMEKRQLVHQIVAQLQEEKRRCADAARAAQAEATDEQSKAENKYDTRGLEASYLAHGQSRQAAEIEEALQLFGALTPREFSNVEPASVGALLEVEQDGARELYFLAPAAGGMELMVDDREVLVVTGRSPLGKSLLGRQANDFLPNGGHIVSVA